jgi:hypothetical protein
MKQGFYKSLLKKIKFIGSGEGNSMAPIIYPKDGLYIEPALINQLKVNDIVSFQQKKKFITHRIIYKKQNYIITKGDNNLQIDGKIYPSQIIGKVQQIKRSEQIINLESLYLVQSTVYFQEIVKIKNAFEKENINFVFLKGLPLHLYYEKTHPRRIYADCDVLIDEECFQKAEKIINKFGYKKTEKKNKQVENNYLKNVNGFNVIFDLHLEPAFLMTQFSGLEALYPQKFINELTEELLKNKKKVKINNEFFFILDTKYLILFLALHLFHHNFRGTFRLDFLNKVIRKNRLSTSNWQKITSIINNYQLGNFVYPVFILLQRHYQPPIPDSFLKSIKPNFTNFKNLNIFDDESRTEAGINRFKLIFTLSPEPLWKKLLIFLNPAVFWSITWVIWKKLFSFFSNQKLIQQDLFVFFLLLLGIF